MDVTLIFSAGLAGRYNALNFWAGLKGRPLQRLRANGRGVLYHDLFGIELRSVVAKAPGSQIAVATAFDRDDHVCKDRPRVIQIVLRRPCRMIWMRVVEAEKLHSLRGSPLLGLTIVRRANEKPAPRTLFGRVRQGKRFEHDIPPTDQRPTAFVGVGLTPVRANRLIGRDAQVERHQPTS
jgi:hypothetical protein